MTVFAKISPKPSITPFTNGKNMLIDNEEKKAHMRARAGSVWSNIARVTDAAAAVRADAAGTAVIVATRGAGECGREGSGNDMEGKDDVGESTLSHGGESEGSPVLACGSADGAGRVGGAFELVDRGKFCYVRADTTQSRREKKVAHTRCHQHERIIGKGKKRTLPVSGDPGDAKAHPHSHSRWSQCWC